MNKKMAKVLILSLVGLFGLITSAFSLSYTTVPGDQSPFAGIGFDLGIDSLGGDSYRATFTITPPSSDVAPPNWYVGWFVLQFDASTPAVITTPPTTVPTGTGPWDVLGPATPVPWGPTTLTPANAGKSGLYLPDFTGSLGTLTGGLLVNSDGPYTFVFNFVETSPLADAVNFQMGFYDGFSEYQGGYQHKQLSKTLTSVPEPSTLLLLGAGLIGFGILGRRKFRKS